MLHGIYNAAMNSKPFEGTITFKDVLEFSKKIFIKNKYDKLWLEEV